MARKKHDAQRKASRQCRRQAKLCADAKRWGKTIGKGVVTQLAIKCVLGIVLTIWPSIGHFLKLAEPQSATPFLSLQGPATSSIAPAAHTQDLLAEAASATVEPKE
jgi:hypothetical protein